ncbi:MAG: glycine cleavage system protein GcvH [Elusimicrobia bacterium]|nr:glycine cleavage system protein GcvH [Elusimicrobiota bacterium]
MPKPENCRYAKSHEWIHAEGAAATVGISDHAQHEITDVVFVELPKPGRKVAAGEACAVVESVKAAFDIYAPVSGLVAEVNQALVQDPALVNQSPHDKGWFFRLTVAEPKELEALMDHAQYQDFLKTAAK